MNMKANVKTERRDGHNLRRQSTAGLFLLTLLAANPLQGLGQGVISTSSTTGAYLNSLFGSPTNSVTVNPDVTINNSGSGNDAVSGDTHTWNLTVDGNATLYGTVNGVNLGAGGSVNNLSGGTIAGGDYGVNINGSAGSVVNSSSIWADIGGNDGVRLRAGGSVTNLSGGTIEGYDNGVNISGGTGSVYNASAITGDYSDGIYMTNGGSVYNDAFGTIYGNVNGVDITGGAGYVTNYNSITGQNQDGVRLQAGGTVDNKSGTILGYDNGVNINGGPGSVVNYGTIQGNNTDGVYMGQGGSVDNQLGGSILGGQYGVEIAGGAGTVINAGTIIGGGGTAISLGNYTNTVTLQTGSYVQGNIMGGSSTDSAFFQGHGSYSNNFLNFETLTVQGDSTGWNLSGTNTFSINATVQSGLLKINGGLTTPLVTVVDATGGLGGTGIIRGIVNNHGYFAPGNSIGTLTILGSMTNWGNYNADVNAAGNSDHILVSGTATINGGNVIAQPAAGVYGSSTTYNILTATNGVAGAYAGASSAALFFSASLSNDLNDVYLILQGEKFVTAANTYNQTAVAGALDGIANSPGALSNLVSGVLLLGTASQAQQALDSLSGEIHGTLGMLDVQQQDAFNNSIALRTGRMSAGNENGGYASSSKPVQLASAGSTLLPMQQAEANQPLDIWLQGFGSFGHLDGDGNALGGDFTISGMSGGLDYRLSPEMLVGLGAGCSQNNADVGGPGANGKVDAFQVAGYGGYVTGPWHLDGIFSYGFLQTDTKRQINVGSIHQEADGKYNGGVLALSAEGGYAFEFDWLTVDPTIGLDYAHLRQNSFSESGIATDGNNYGLNVKSVDMDSFRTALGVRLAAQFGKKDGVQFIPALRAVWEHEFSDRTADVNARFVGGSGDFTVRGVKLGADSGILDASLTVAFNKAIQGFVNFDANLNSQLSSHTISGGLSYSW
jgi:outer membrane autotransporter protein